MFVDIAHILKFIFIVAIIEHLYIDLINYSDKDSLGIVPRPMKPDLRTYGAIFCVSGTVTIFNYLV